MKLSIEVTISTPDLELRIEDYDQLLHKGFVHVDVRDTLNAGDFAAVRAPDAQRSTWAGHVIFTKTLYVAVFPHSEDLSLLYLMRREE